MSRIPTPATVDDTPAAARPLLEGVRRSLGSVPNLFRLVANSPSALEGWLGLQGALQKGRLDARTRERIALAVANVNGCSYCNSAHGFVAQTLLKLDAAEIAANRAGTSTDAKAAAAVAFAVRLTQARGHVDEAEVAALKAAGYDDGQIVEIVAHVALNTFTNYVNEALDTEIDFPIVRTPAA